MIEIINIYEFVQEAQYIMSYERLREETYNRFRYLFEDIKSTMYGIEFSDEEAICIVSMYDPLSETRVEMQSKLIYLIK